MKKKIIVVMVFAFFIGMSLWANDPVEGYWISIDEKTEKPTGGWHIYTKSDGLLYGELVSLADLPVDQIASACKDSYKGFPVGGKVSEMTSIGTPWIWGLKRKKSGYWADGQIIDPSDGNVYFCRIRFHEADNNKYKTNTLEMRGEIIFGIGRSQFWIEATKEQALSIQKK